MVLGGVGGVLLQIGAASATKESNTASDRGRMEHDPEGPEAGEVPANAVIGDSGGARAEDIRRAAEDKDGPVTDGDAPSDRERCGDDGARARVPRCSRIEQGAWRNEELLPVR